MIKKKKRKKKPAFTLIIQTDLSNGVQEINISNSDAPDID